uniref:BolA-like protein n=1 Tax=Lotharella oceanica TaxID=641309 RepID=A0A7S2XHK7_9EUKA|mmetsp:Transcript_8536/g.16792  ORF Transcript_8536/g.16792 Transcript_8536/m.16792 type:complete len:108 (+) Transcript_8536:135-458(+)
MSLITSQTTGHERLFSLFASALLLWKVPKGSETHFKVVVVSEKFNEVKHIDRHRLVNKALSQELEGPVHALSVKAKTPAQWAKSQKVDPSPSCRGGSKHDPHFNKQN